MTEGIFYHCQTTSCRHVFAYRPGYKVERACPVCGGWLRLIVQRDPIVDTIPRHGGMRVLDHGFARDLAGTMDDIGVAKDKLRARYGLDRK